METGLTHQSSITVATSHLACTLGSGDLQVLATPAMLALMENAAMLAVAPHLAHGESTVGGFISSSHIRPTGLGHTVTATAELVEIKGRKLKFKVSACDDNGLIGEGEHLRFIISKDQFMQKVV